MRVYSRSHSRRSSLSVGHIVVLLGSVLVILGFFLPWLVVKPTNSLSSVTNLTGSAFGDALGIGGLGHLLEGVTRSLTIHIAGWKLATGVSLKDLWLSNGWGALLLSGASQDPEIQGAFSTWVIPPLVWLFAFPLLAVVNVVILFISMGRAPYKIITIIGGVLLLLIIGHIIVFYVSVHAVKAQAQRQLLSSTSDQDLLANLGALLLNLQAGIGAWVTLIGALLWVVGAGSLISAAPPASRLGGGGRRLTPRRIGRRVSTMGVRSGGRRSRFPPSSRRSRFRR